jgi:hypothetical protein
VYAQHLGVARLAHVACASPPIKRRLLTPMTYGRAVLSLGEADVAHIAFGRGAYACPGGPLGRAEAKISPGGFSTACAVFLIAVRSR